MGMAVRPQPQPGPGTAARRAWLPQGFDAWVALPLAAGLLLLYGPVYWQLAHTLWPGDEQGHGPIVLTVSLWLLFAKRHQVAAVKAHPLPGIGWTLLILGLLLYALGTSQDIIMFAVGSQIFVLASLLLIFKGARAVRAAWFPLFFMLFMVPLPEALVAAVTGPLKSAVSAVASNLLYAIGYPVGRSGVVMTVGPYQLLVADACAGLNSMFTLEALGLLYMNLMGYASVRRNVALAILLIPTAFVANIVRVMILVLVTYHYGDAAGQGFVHGFAGMVLFMVALMLMLVLDKGLALFFSTARGKA